MGAKLKTSNLFKGAVTFFNQETRCDMMHFFVSNGTPTSAQRSPLPCSGGTSKINIAPNTSLPKGKKISPFESEKVCRIQFSQQILILHQGNFCQFYLSVVSARMYFLYFSTFSIFFIIIIKPSKFIRYEIFTPRWKQILRFAMVL